MVKDKRKTEKIDKIDKSEKSRRRGETRTSMFITDSIYELCGQISDKVRLPMRQVWEAGVLKVKDMSAEEFTQLLGDNGIKAGWRAR
jgi:hypothetical protein